MSTSTKSCRATSTDMVDIRPTRAIIHGTKTNRDVILRASDEDARRTSTVNICNQVCLRGDAGISGFPPVPAGPPNSPRQSGTLSLLGTSLAASVASRGPHSALKNARKNAQSLCDVSPLETTLMDLLASVANKRLTPLLSPLDATLTKNIRGWGVPRLASLHALPSHSKSIVKERRCVLTP